MLFTTLVAVAGFAGGVFAHAEALPLATSLLAKFNAARAVTNAKTLIAAAEANAVKLSAAYKLLAAQTKVTVIPGTTGPTGA